MIRSELIPVSCLFVQEALGDVVYAQLPEPEDDITAGEDCGALESVKAASEIYSPVSGKVLEKNEAVESAPALINSSAMEEGWLFKVGWGMFLFFSTFETDGLLFILVNYPHTIGIRRSFGRVFAARIA